MNALDIQQSKLFVIYSTNSSSKLNESSCVDSNKKLYHEIKPNKKDNFFSEIGIKAIQTRQHNIVTFVSEQKKKII